MVRKHLTSEWRKPLPEHTRIATERLLAWLAERGQPLVLDSFCGTGMSTAALAERHPDCAVVGVDKSSARLGRHGSQGAYLLLRAECEPLWRALALAGISASHHYLLYPNPWPKQTQLKRRIHGHPGFPWLVRLGGTVELRSNWPIYVAEFAQAMAVAGVTGQLALFKPTPAITLFERKYHDRGQTLWRWQGHCSDVANTGPLG